MKNLTNIIGFSVLLLLSFGDSLKAQNVSFSKSTHSLVRSNSKDKKKENGRLKGDEKEKRDTLKNRIDRQIISVTEETAAAIKKLEDSQIPPDTLARLVQSKIELRRQTIIAIEQRYKILDKAYQNAYKRPRNTLFLPAFNSSQAINFYLESDTVASKFFSNNSIIYNSALQKLTFADETYSDYFGPIRFGIGFLLSSSSNSPDSVQAKDDVVQKIAMNAGNVYGSLSFPLLQWTDKSFFSVKSSFYSNIGADIPKNSTQSNTYGLTTTSGLNLNVYSKGFFEVVQFFYTGKVFFVGGNKNFEQRLGLNNFWMMQNSVGLAVNDKFRFRLDVYSALIKKEEKEFVRAAFPVTVSFDIVNPF
jgi:hypothetical protein